MRRVLAIVLGMTFAVGLATPARASHTNLVDANDVRGLLDIHTVVLRHDHGPYAWVLRTFAAWTTKGIWDRGVFVVELDTLGSEAVDYFAILRSDGRSMLGDLFRRHKDGDEVRLRSLRAWRAGSHGAGIEIPRHALRYGAGRTLFRWSTESSFTGERCRTTCIDDAPEGDAMVEQEL